MSQQTKGKSKRGFASMSKERQREIASRGGKTAHARGKAHVFTSQEAVKAAKLASQSRKQKILSV